MPAETRHPLSSALFWGALVVLASWRPCLGAAESQEGFRRVFIVHSYSSDYIWTQHINAGIREALKDVNTVYDYFYLDAKNHPDTAWQTRAAKKVLKRIRDFDPEVVIPADDVAQEYLTVPYLKGKPRPQVVFCGVNAPASKYGFPASNVSGVLERWHYREAFALLKRIVPQTMSVAFLVDASESGQYVIDDLLEDFSKNGPYALKLAAVEKIRTFQEWKKKILKYQTKADCLCLGLYHTLFDEKTGKVVPPEAVMAWTHSVNRKPTIGFSDVSVENGVLCGVLESGQEQGFLAGSMAREVLLRGIRAGDLPMRVNHKGVILVNLKTAERLGFSIPYEIIEAAGEVVK